MKLSILEAKLLKSPEVDTEHVLLAIMKDNENKAAEILESQEVTYRKVMDRLVPHKEEPKDGLDFGEEDEDEDDGIRRRRPDEAICLTVRKDSRLPVPSSRNPVRIHLSWIHSVQT